jgi:cytochrome b6-f complex iron-sulfur subunit
MKLKTSLFSRRTFLNGLLGGGLAGLGAAFIGPVARFMFPPTPEPDEIKIPAAAIADLPPDEAKSFAWGSKPGLLKRGADGELQAFVAVCTHLDCNVTWLPGADKFFCACHQGWYDANGINIAGPPPKPLRRLGVAVVGPDIVITKQAG